MSDIEVVIKIPEKVYNANRLGEISPWVTVPILDAVQSGTPLPKGHGRLIDADKIEWYGCDFEDGAMCRKNSGNCNVCIFAECDADQVRNLPTIIEADKEKE